METLNAQGPALAGATDSDATSRRRVLTTLTHGAALKMALLKVVAMYLAAAVLAVGAGLPVAHAAGSSDAAQRELAPGASELRVERSGDAIVVQAHADVDADRALTWATLSDYDRLAEFIPGMSASRTVSRDGAEAVIEQQGSAGFGPFRQKFAVVLGVKETRHESITASRLGGDFHRFDAQYELVPLGEHRTRIVYRATLVPAMPVPPLVGLPVMRSMIRSQFDALVQEVQRRAAHG